jgi:(2Fe-2S) ferredoxin
MCRGEYCNLGYRADKLIPRMKEAVEAANARVTDGPLCASFRTANCLSMCGRGPNLVVYPEDDVYNALDADKLEVVITRYLACDEVAPHPGADAPPLSHSGERGT